VLKSRKITLGTKEWADSNVNCYKGCSNNCRYCYAKIMAIRFKRATNDTWKKMELNIKNVEKGYHKRKGRVMFPTSHDITEESLENCLIVLRKLVQAGNEVLVTTKPRINCLKQICENFGDFKDKIQFRFTITSFDDKKLKFWEPNAPTYDERLESLKYAFNKKFKTSVSIEPFLDEDPGILLELLWTYGAPPIDVWIGSMNHRDRLYQYSAELRGLKEYLEMIYSPNWLKIIHGYIKQELDNNIHFKDGFLNQMRRK